MRKEDFFEILGELDGRIVAKAREPMKKTKKIPWKICGAMAACLILACSAAAHFLLPSHTEDKIAGDKITEDEITDNGCTADIAPMVYVNDTLYMLSSSQQPIPGQKDDFLYLGKIESMVPSESAPNQNFQANDPIVGSEIYQYGENIVVQINGAYRLYEKYTEPEDPDWDSLSEEEKMEWDPTYKGE